MTTNISPHTSSIRSQTGIQTAIQATASSKTYLGHPHLQLFREFLQRHCRRSAMRDVERTLLEFIRQYPLPIGDFPRLEGRYTRTVLFRGGDGFEAMVARWSRGVTTPVHGHPAFTLYCVVQGALAFDNYRLGADGLQFISSERLKAGEASSFYGKEDRFDNNIHQVHSLEETLSIHISSDDGTKGEIFG